MNYWDFIKIKSLCTTKAIVNKTKRQPMGWEKIFANDITDKGLLSKIYKELIKLNTQKTKKIQSRMGRRHEQTFLQRRHTNVQQIQEKLLNTNQHHNEIPPHMGQNG